MLNGKKIVVGITGCSAANKALDIISALKKMHADVYAVMTKIHVILLHRLWFKEV